MEKDGEGDRRPLTWGTIVDETPQFIPCIVLGMVSEAVAALMGASRLYGEVVTTRAIAVTRELSHEEDPFAVQVPMTDEDDLRRRALGAAILRACTCVNQYIFFFTLEDERFRRIGIFHPHHGPRSLSRRSSLTVEEGGNLPGMKLSGRTDIVSQSFAEHCIGAIRTTIKTRAAVPQQSCSRFDQPPIICERCGQLLWFGPCCIRPFCRACDPTATHLISCSEPLPAVRMFPRFRLANGRQPPPVFDRLPHPLWCMYRFVEGERFTLVSYFNVEDSHYYHRDRGIRFAAHLFRRGNGTAIRWVWWVEMTFRLVHRVRYVDISWRLHLADEFDSWVV